MGALVHADVQYADRMGFPALARELNIRLRRLANGATVNFRESYPQVDAVILADATQTVWLPLEAYEVESITLKTSTGTGSVTPRIGTTAMTVTGGTPITATTTATTTAVTGGNVVAALDDVNLVVTGLTGVLTAALKVRRLG